MKNQLDNNHKQIIMEQMHYPNTLKSFFIFLIQHKIPFLPIAEPNGGVISNSYVFFEWDLSYDESRYYLTTDSYNVRKCLFNSEAHNKLFSSDFYNTTYWINFSPGVKGQVSAISALLK